MKVPEIFFFRSQIRVTPKKTLFTARRHYADKIEDSTLSISPTHPTLPQSPITRVQIWLTTWAQLPIYY